MFLFYFGDVFVSAVSKAYVLKIFQVGLRMSQLIVVIVIV